MKIKLSWVEKKHIDSLNKDLMECDGTDETGKAVKFTIWSDFPGFNEINAASEIEGNLWEKPGTGKWTLYPPKTPTTSKSSTTGGFKAGMQKMVEEKNANIRQSQENKELGIKTSSTIRMATDVVIATLANEKIIDESVIKGKIEMWRRWFWMHWDDPESYPPFE
jgi:hypothetical protein